MRAPAASDAWAPFTGYPNAANFRVAYSAAARVDPAPPVADVVSPQVYFFGGQNFNGVNVAALRSLSGSALLAVATNGTLPSARRLAALVYLRNCYGPNAPCMVLNGGTTNSVPLADTWVLDMRSGTPPFRWSQPTFRGALPPGRYGHSGVASPDGTQAFFFGGMTAAGASSDVYVLAPGGFSDPRDSEMVNIALNKWANQSSTFQTWNAAGPGRAVDGNTISTHNDLANAPASNNVNNLCTHTILEAGPWWRVDLGAELQFQYIRIWDRTDCCAGRIAGFEVRVSSTAPSREGAGASVWATAKQTPACTNPFTDIFEATATIDLTTTPGGRCSSGRYVWVSLPDTYINYLTLCEVAVYAKAPWVWRQLSGVAEVAQGKKTEQSSTELCCAGGDSSRAVDGNPSSNNYNLGSCSHTITNFNQPNTPAYWLVDLGAVYDVQSVEFWPRLDCCAAGRNRRWRITVGVSRDVAYATELANVPANMLPGTPSYTLALPAPTRGRFVQVRRDFVLNDDNILQICEFKVNAALLLDQPVPRVGAATAAWGGNMLVFGGSDAAGFRLNDVRVFDMINRRWMPAEAPLNTPPQQRSNAALFVLSSTRVAAFGGSSATDTLADISYYEPLACPPLQTGLGAEGVTSQRTTHAGTFQYFECAPGFTHTNQGRPLVCDPSSGRWQGLYNLATGRVCLPDGPGKPTIISTLATSPTSVLVSYSPPAVLNGLSYYTIEATVGNTYIERFNSFLGPTDTAAWIWRDERRTSTVRFPDGVARIEAGASSDCTVATPISCPVYHRAWPAGVGRADWAIEAWVAFDSNMVQNTQFAGIAVLQDNSVQGLNASLAITVGLWKGNNYNSWNLQWGTLSNLFTIPLSRPVYGAWMRLERDSPNGAWDVTTNPSTYTASYRLSVRDSWIPLTGQISDTQIAYPAVGAVTVAPGLDPAKVRVGVLLRNANGGSRAAVIADNLRISARACPDPGSVRIVSSSTLSAEVTGLTANTNTYRFVVTGASPVVVGTPSDPSGIVRLDPAPAGPVVPLTGNIALGRPTTMARRFSPTGEGPELGVDGITSSDNWFQTATPGQGGCSDAGCWWQVDLGVQTDVRRVRVVNRWDQLITIDRAVGIDIVVSTTGGATYVNSIGVVCPVNDTALRAAPYIAQLRCVGTGRYVTARSGSGNFLHLSEVEVFAANACPPRNSTNAIPDASGNSNCANATYGTVCVQQCAFGFTPVGGSERAVCRGSSWDAAPLVCQPICPELRPPEDSNSCTRTLISDSFSPSPTTGSYNDTLSRWVSLDPGNQPLGKAWFAGDGVVQGAARWGCRTEMFLVAGSQEIFDFQGTFTVTAMVSTRDRAGVVRALDKGNFLRFYMDVIEGTLVLDRSQDGVLTTLSDVRMPLSPDTLYRMAMRQSGAVVTLFLNDIAVLSTLDRTIVVGYVGLYAGSTAIFDDFSMVTDCFLCAGAVPQDVCKYTCRPGLLLKGNDTRVCTLDPSGTTASWSGSDLSCELPPVVFNGGTRAIAENSLRNAAVGDPLVASLASPDESLVFAINSEAPSFAPTFTFWIDRCSGQVRVREPTRLNFENLRVVVLNVSAYVEGRTAGAPRRAETFRFVTVNILDVNEAPVILRGQALNISEAAQLGEIIGAISYWDPENTTARFSILSPSSGGIVAFANATAGTLAIADTTLLDFESGTTAFTLTVQAVDTWNPLLSDSATVTLRVLDAPDAPVLLGGDSRILDSAAIVGAVFSTPVNATLQDNGPPPGPFAGSVSFSLLPFPQALAACPALALETEYATTTGSASTGAPLFSINPTTGFLSVAAVPAVAWTGRPARPADGFARAVYRLCINASATRFPGRSTVGVVRAVVVANVGSVPQISDYWVGNGTTGNRMDTITPTQVWFSGLNLPVGGGNGSITATYSNPSLGLSFTSSGCNVLNSTTMVCWSVPGVGVDLEWSLVNGNSPVPSTVALLTAYYAPQVASVTNHTGMAHEGGQWVMLTGRYLGGMTLASGSYARLTYGPTATALKYSCTLSWPASWTEAQRDSQAYCVSARGAGAGLVWSLNVGGQVVTADPSDTVSQLAYIPPTITSIEVPDAVSGSRVDATVTSNLDTRGGTRLILRGSGFGGDPSNTVTVRASTFSTAEAVAFTMVGCARLVETVTTAVSCFSPPGIGANLALKAEVEGQQSAQTAGNASRGLGVSFAPPQVRQLSGTFRGASTAGGASFFVEGDFLGPDLTGSPEWVRYGPLVAGAPSKYVATRCSVFVPHTTLACTMAEGTGRGHFLQVSVGTQASNVFNGSMSYGPPVVGGFESSPGSPAVPVDTEGGQSVDIVGTNFGPADESTPVNVSYAAKLEPWFTQPDGVVLTYTPANCTVVTPHTRMRCITAPGAGRNLVWSVNVDGLDSVDPTTAYEAPSITEIVSSPAGLPVVAANVLGNALLEIRGANFGPNRGAGNFGGLLVQELTYGFAGNERAVNTSSITYVSHTVIRALLPPGIGSNMTFRITVAGQTSVSTSARFSYATPSIARSLPAVANTFSDPAAPTKVVLRCFNLPMTDPRSNVRVLFGWAPFARTIDLDVYPRTPTTWQSYRNPDGSYNVTFELPRNGAGSQVSLAIAIESVNSGGASFPTILTNALLFRYNAPVISNVVVLRTRFRAGAANVSAGESDVSFPCPWRVPVVGWSCADSLSTLIVYGANFGGPPATVSGPVTNVIDAFGVQRALEFGTLATNTTPPVWTLGAANDNLLWLVSWDHTRIIALSKRTQGTLRVRLAAPNGTGTLSEETVEAKFDNIAPEIKTITVNPSQAPTAGGAIIAMQVANIINSEFLRVSVGAYNCTLVESAQSSAADVTEATFRSWFSGQTSSVVDTDTVWTVFCRMPPGQGRALPVIVTRVLSGSADPSDAGVTVSYAPPRLDSVIVDDGVPMTSLSAASTVTVATNGSLVRVTGTNLGISPVIALGDQFTRSGSDLRSCPGLSAPTEFPHTCFEFTTPEGEGSGELLPPYIPAGFTWTLVAGSQSSATLRYRHAPPRVTAVVSSTGLFPTSGNNVTLTIRGVNFGKTKDGRDESVLVSFRRAGEATPPQACLSAGGEPAVRADHSTITCVLPDGSGKNMEVLVVIAGTASANSSLGFSYDAPTFTAVTAYAYAGVGATGEPILDAGIPRASYNSTDQSYALYAANYTLEGGPIGKPQLRAGTTGNDTVLVIYGSNLGRRDPAHCVCLLDVGRPTYLLPPAEFTFAEGDECVCNNQEDYLGEGEVPFARILSWTHERIVLRPNEGVGLKEIRVSVRGSTLGLERFADPWRANQWTLAYEPPRIESMTPATGSTDGGFIVELRGSNFGPRPGNFSTYDDQYASDFFTRDGWPQPLSVAPSLPIAFLRIRFHRGSVASSTTIRGEPAFPDADITKRIISWAHDRIVFEAPGGIGANRAATVTVVLGRDSNRREWPSAPIAFSYLPPTIAYANPSIVYMTDKVRHLCRVCTP